ncbi:MAG: ATPase domain-containing protein [Candidatus Bathyarchaeia archaeon]
MSLKRTKTGIKGLDSYTGGFTEGSLIMLSGEAGTGKTIFSAEFIYRGAENGENGVYLSFAETREVFYSNMRSFGWDFERLEKEGKFKFLETPSMREEGVSSMLEMVLDEVRSLGAKRLAVDSFSALAQAFKERIDVRIVLHTVLDKIIKQAKCTTVLIVEIPKGTNQLGLGMEEFVADCIIKLSRREFEGQLLRELELLKLRGAEIRQSKIAFTLKGGFKMLTPLTSEGDIEEPKRYRPIPNTETHISSGVRDLDEIIGGGARIGTYNLFEVGRDVPFSITRLVRSMIYNCVSQDYGVVILPPRGVSAHRVKARMAPMLGDEAFEHYVRIVDFGEEAKAPYIVNLEGKSIREDFELFWGATSKLREKTGKPVFSVVGFDSLEYMYGRDEALKILGRDVTLTRNFNDVRLNIIRPTITLADQLRALADIYFKVDEIDGAIFLRGVKPKTPLYSFNVSTCQGVSEVKLIPVV